MIDFSRFHQNSVYDPDFGVPEGTSQNLLDFRIYNTDSSYCYNEIQTDGSIWCFGNQIFRFNMDI